MDSLATEQKKKKRPRMLPSYRLTISLLTFAGMFLSAQSQSTMGAAIVYMVHTEGRNTTFETFDWDKGTQGWIQGSRFLSYYLAQLPSGMLTSYMTSRMMATIGFVAMGTLDVMTVVCAKYSLGLLIFARFLQGLGNALITTCFYDIIGKWFPKDENSLLAGIAGSGYFAGACLAFGFSFIASEDSNLGWPSNFYFSGGLSLAFSLVWCLFADNEPATSRWASQEEKDYIMACKRDEGFRGKIPWRAMVSSGPVYAIAVAQIASDWIIYLSLTVIPSFFIDVMHMSRRYADLVSGAPYTVVLLSCALFGRGVDMLRQRRWLSTAGARRLAQGIASLVPAACCLLLSRLSASQGGLAVALYFVLVVTQSCMTAGLMANISDLAPQLAGATMTVSQTLAAWTAFVVPVLVDYLTLHKTQEQWNTVLYITAGVQVACYFGFCMLCSGELQPWAKSEEATLLEEYQPLWTYESS